MLIVALGAGIGIGTAAGRNTSQLNAANQKLATAHRQIGTLQSQASSLQSRVTILEGQYQQAKVSAQNATTIANQNASIAWTTRNAQLDQKAATLKQQQATLNAQLGNVQANSISQDGVYVIGRDMKGGVWHTNGGSQCYYRNWAAPIRRTFWTTTTSPALRPQTLAAPVRSISTVAAPG